MTSPNESHLPRGKPAASQTLAGADPLTWDEIALMDSIFLSDLSEAVEQTSPKSKGPKAKRSVKQKGSAHPEFKATQPPDFEVIKRQIEFYFSDVSLPSDPFLLQQISKSADGYVSLSLIMSFKKLRCFGTDPRPAAEALKDSDTLEVSPDGTGVRRRLPLAPNALENLQRRVLLITQLPDTATKETVMQLCSRHGTLGFVRVRSADAKDPLIETVPGVKRWIGRSQFAVVEFSSRDEANKAKLAIDDPSKWGGVRAAVLNVKTRDASRRTTPRQAPGEGGAQPGAGQAAAKPSRPKKDYRTWASGTGVAASTGGNAGPRQPAPREKGFGMGRGAVLSSWPLAPGAS